MQDAQKREHFVHEADEVAAWISAKKAVASSEELGRDLEHVKLLQGHFADFLKDLRANETRMASVSALAEKLQKEKHPDMEVVKTHLETLREAWRELNTMAEHRERRLAAAHEIQHFNRWTSISSVLQSL